MSSDMAGYYKEGMSPSFEFHKAIFCPLSYQQKQKFLPRNTVCSKLRAGTGSELIASMKGLLSSSHSSLLPFSPSLSVTFQTSDLFKRSAAPFLHLLSKAVLLWLIRRLRF